MRDFLPSTRAVSHSPRGMTLVEMLVSLAATLILLGLVAQLFSMVGQGVSGSRNMVAIADAMRVAQYRLRHDLDGATAFGKSPPLKPEQNLGYFEYIEGPDSDRTTYRSGQPFAKDSFFVINNRAIDTTPDRTGKKQLDEYILATDSDDRLVGDIDDVLLMTVHNQAEPFRGIAMAGAMGTSALQSPYAEVIWYCRPTPNSRNPRLYTLYRRQRLVMAHPGVAPFVDPRSALDDPNPAPGLAGPSNTAPLELALLTDVSCRVQEGILHPNTLGDLTKRENRFLHAGNYPHVFDPADPNLLLVGDRLGEDVVLTNVIGFDVRAYDPTAPVRIASLKRDLSLIPGDAGYASGENSGMLGAFVDLNWGGASKPRSFFSQLDSSLPRFGDLGTSVCNDPFGANVGPPPHGSSANLLLGTTYDTWSSHYESDGRDQDGDGLIDEGTDGFDDAAGFPPKTTNGVADDPWENETRPPYPVALSAIEIRIRCYEPSGRKIRQITVRHALPVQ